MHILYCCMKCKSSFVIRVFELSGTLYVDFICPNCQHKILEHGNKDQYEVVSDKQPLPKVQPTNDVCVTCGKPVHIYTYFAKCLTCNLLACCLQCLGKHRDVAKHRTDIIRIVE